ncbi:Fc receptor-like protein 4 [Ornithorhynchus anatinus]|uniref:Fc receptor-like protein 4 n=1 Tax=Ornithorhynchus anatinus TaxID=9258 RepID=UPI0019D46383|nr:Fc receptor-like protein 4 [Ornithorhynchus anatinus]
MSISWQRPTSHFLVDLSSRSADREPGKAALPLSLRGERPPAFTRNASNPFLMLLRATLLVLAMDRGICVLILRPVLRAAPSSQPLEGSPLTLTCDIQMDPQSPGPPRPDPQLHFSFYKDSKMVRGWDRSPGHRIHTAQLGDSGVYLCQAATLTFTIRKQSAQQHIRVKRVPVSGVTLEAKPPGGQVEEGRRLVLVCSAAAGTGPVNFSLHRAGRDWARSLKTVAGTRRMAEMELAAVRESDGGEYQCAASNGDGLVTSDGLNVTVTGSGRRKRAVVLGAVTALLACIGAVAALLFRSRPWRKPETPQDLETPPQLQERRCSQSTAMDSTVDADPEELEPGDAAPSGMEPDPFSDSSLTLPQFFPAPSSSPQFPERKGNDTGLPQLPPFISSLTSCAASQHTPLHLFFPPVYPSFG